MNEEGAAQRHWKVAPAGLAEDVSIQKERKERIKNKF